jgi:protein TonB
MSAAAHRRDNRVFHYAILLSIVLHGLALLAAPSLRDASRRVEVWPGPIAARLVQPPPAPVPAPPKPEAPAAPRVEQAQRPVAKPAPSPKPPPVAKTVPTAPLEPAPAASTPLAEPAPAIPAKPAAAAATSAAATPPANAVDADSLARFRMEVIEAARKNKRYPRAAMDNNWEGRASVRVSFGIDGRRTSIAITRSSGHEILDKQAIDTVTGAEVPVPPALRGKEFAFEIQIIFDLKESPSG